MKDSNFLIKKLSNKAEFVDRCTWVLGSENGRNAFASCNSIGDFKKALSVGYSCYYISPDVFSGDFKFENVRFEGKPNGLSVDVVFRLQLFPEASGFADWVNENVPFELSIEAFVEEISAPKYGLKEFLQEWFVFGHDDKLDFGLLQKYGKGALREYVGQSRYIDPWLHIDGMQWIKVDDIPARERESLEKFNEIQRKHADELRALREKTAFEVSKISIEEALAIAQSNQRLAEVSRQLEIKRLESDIAKANAETAEAELRELQAKKAKEGLTNQQSERLISLQEGITQYYKELKWRDSRIEELESLIDSLTRELAELRKKFSDKDWYDELSAWGKVLAYVKTFLGLTLLVTPMVLRDYYEWRRGLNFWICVLVAVIGFAFLVGRDRLKSFFKSSVRLLLGKSVSLNIKETLLEILRCWLCACMVGWLITLLAMQSLILLDIVGLYEYSFSYLKQNGDALWATGIMLALCRFFILVVMRRRLCFNKDVIWKWGIICLLPIVVFLAAKENSSYFRKKLRRIAKRQDPTHFAIKAYDGKDYSGFWSLVGRADVENIEIIRRLGTAYQKGYGIEGPDYRKAIEQYNKLLNFDTTGEIEFRIGLCLHLCKEDNKAKVCLINAVKKGYCEAFVLLGSFYEYGTGGGQVDLEKAAECYEKAMKTKNLKFYKLAEQNLNRVRRTLDRTIRKTRNENASKNYELAWSCIEYKDGSVSLTSPAVPTNTTGELIVPSVLAGRTVRSIGEQSFGKCDLLKSVIISEGVSSIDGSAFLGCKSLENVEMPSSVTNIGDYAFAMCKSLKSITIPNGVKNVSQGMFEGCSALETVLLPSSVTNIGVVAFQDCKALTSVKIPDGVVSIGFSAFACCTSLASVTIPSNVRSIEGHAFSGCKSLVALRIPMGVARIGGGAFTDCDSLKIFVVDPENPFYCMRDGFLLTRDGKMLIDYPVKNKISLIIPDGVKCIGDNALSHSKVLDSVTFPESVIEIKRWALRDCESLKTVKFLGDKPLVDSGAFFNISTNCTVIIPAHNKTWKDVGDMWYGMRVERGEKTADELVKEAHNAFVAKDWKTGFDIATNISMNAISDSYVTWWVGCCYSPTFGMGYPKKKDYEKAYEWFKHTAELEQKSGDGIVQCILGDIEMNGQGCATNIDNAVAWYRISAERKYNRGCYELGKCYEDNIVADTNDNLVAATNWYFKSMELKYEKAKEAYERVLRKLKENAVPIVTNHKKDIKKIQLWEGGPYWADRNIGAEKPEDYGYYFWWGDTVGYKWVKDKWIASDGSNSKISFDSENTPTSGKSISDLQNQGWIIDKNGVNVLTPKYDAARVHWGGDWRMPTKQELEDLYYKCDWIWRTKNGVAGYVVQGKGNYSSAEIFLPCAGYCNGYSISLDGLNGGCWSSVPGSGSSDAWGLSFFSHCLNTDSYFRYYGQSVRPLQGVTK